MQKNLTTKTIIIAATILLCIYGIIDIPKSKAELIKNVQQNVRLGLDLKGGSHLILQVQVQDALKAEADQLMERLKEELNKARHRLRILSIATTPCASRTPIRFRSISKGVSAQKTSAFRSLVTERFPNWILTPVNATDYRLNLRPSELLALKRDTRRAVHSDPSATASIIWASPSLSCSSTGALTLNSRSWCSFPA